MREEERKIRKYGIIAGVLQHKMVGWNNPMPIGKAHWTALGARVRLQGMAEKSISGCWDSAGS